MKKMQASLIILIMVVSVAVVGWAYTMTTGTPGGIKTMDSQMQITRATYMMDSTKSSSVIAGQAAMYMALHENAQSGGINDYEGAQMEDKRYWFCNGNTIPDAAYINYFLSMRTKQLVNTYLGNLNDEVITVTPATCVDYGLTQSDISSETTTFTADFYGSTITVSDPTHVTSDNDFASSVTGIPLSLIHI